MKDVVLTFQHCRQLGYCMHGVRRFCTRYGFNFRDMRDGKITAQMFYDTGNALAMRLAEHATRMEKGE